jgi:AcrR family transcriptional regulator
MLIRVEASTVGAPVTDRPASAIAPEPARRTPAVATAPGTSGTPGSPVTPGPSVTPGTPPVRRKRGRPRDPEADGRILAAASALILLRGFDSMTVDEVASNAGVGKATVYRRWSRKEDLAVAAMEQLYKDEMPSPDTGSIRGDLEALFSSVLTFVNSPAGIDHVRTTIKESMRDDRIAALYREATLRAERSATEVFERAIARGEVRADIAVRPAVQFLGSIVAMRVITGQEMPALEEIDDLVELVLNGIAAA